MVTYEFQFKRRTNSGWVKLDVGEDGTVTVPATSFKNGANVCHLIQQLRRMMLEENWIDVEMKEK